MNGVIRYHLPAESVEGFLPHKEGGKGNKVDGDNHR